MRLRLPVVIPVMRVGCAGGVVCAVVAIVVAIVAMLVAMPLMVAMAAELLVVGAAALREEVERLLDELLLALQVRCRCGGVPECGVP